MKEIFRKIGKWMTNYKVVLAVFMLLAIAAGLQSYLGHLQPLVDGGLPYTQYNNFLIFKYSFYHLIELKDLYILYPEEYGDLYKYSPTFALLFAPLAVLPDWIGAIFWNLLNALVLFFGFKGLPNFKTNTKIYMLWFVVIELMTNMQNDQSNGLMAGLLILAFTYLQKNKYAIATLFIVLTVYIKLFGIVAFSLFLLFPRKGKFILYSGLWMVLFAVLPLIVIPIEQFKFLYTSWGKLLFEDHSLSYGFSLMGWLVTWFNININKNILVLTGVVLFMIPFIRYKLYSNSVFRTLILSSILIWVVIFNHKAESPSFIIAMSGMALFYFTKPLSLKTRVIVISSFVLTSLSTTDIFPHSIRIKHFYPYLVKVLPSIFAWFCLTYELIFKKYNQLPTNNS